MRCLEATVGLQVLDFLLCRGTPQYGITVRKATESGNNVTMRNGIAQIVSAAWVLVTFGRQLLK